jgi:hypothetical protein
MEMLCHVIGFQLGGERGLKGLHYMFLEVLNSTNKFTLPDSHAVFS